MIADHIKPEKEDYFLGKVNSVEMGMVETDDFSSCVDVLLNGLVRLYEGR